MRKRIIAITVMLSILCAGCTIETKETEKLEDLEFTIVEEEKIPEELLQVIEERKAEEFKITYRDSEYMYIARGYGEQQTGGYSISVSECYLTGNAVYIKTNLIGPDKTENNVQTPSYPYVVIKLTIREEPISFK